MKKKISLITLITLMFLLIVIGICISIQRNIKFITATENFAKAYELYSNDNKTSTWEFDMTNSLFNGKLSNINTNLSDVTYASSYSSLNNFPDYWDFLTYGGGMYCSNNWNPNGYGWPVQPGYFIPIYGGYQIYCLEPGAGIEYSNLPPDTRPAVYHKIGIRNLPPAVAYIISGGGSWVDKQQALWKLYYYQHLNDGFIQSPPDSSERYWHNQSLYNGVEEYYAYHNNIKNGYNVRDNTNKQKLQAEFNNNSYEAGPFNITYPNGIYGTKAFAGISNIKLVGLDENKREIGTIPIKGFKIDGKFISASTIFKYNRSESVSGTPIPSGKDFYVVFDEPSNTNMFYAQLKIDFTYMKVEGQYAILTGNMIRSRVYQTAQALGVTEARRNYYSTSLTLQPVELLIKLGGNVWLDGLTAHGKDNESDGKNKTANDIPLSNVKVTLYTSDGKLAEMKRKATQSGISSADIMHRVNPTYTDSKGDYLFDGLAPGKQYYAVFEYDGQMYLPTTKLAENTNTSKALEKANDRTSFNNKFAEIRSYPENYQTSNSLGKGLGTYNKTYSQYDLMGYTLDENGKYKKTGTQLIDGFLYDENGNQTKTYSQGQISKKIVEYINSNKKSPDIKTIYNSIAGSNTETWRKLQFIEDCKIKAYSDTYKGSYKYKDYINLGLWRRQQQQLLLTKDVLYAATKINGKTEVYQYNNRDEKSNEWEIQTRMQNYAQYYGGAYVNGIYKTDYTYDGANSNGGSDLEVYITYKITVKNTSNNLLSQVTEVVDYYEKNYTFMSNLSWVMYDQVNLKQTDYYNMIDTLALNKIPNAKNINSSTSSRYGNSTHQDVTNKMNATYIKGLQDKKLGVGEQAYIYLTFKVKENSEGVILNDYTNYAEINGYKTFYANGITLPNNSKISNNTTVAGIIDQKATPGNLTSADLNGTKHEKNFENDTDRAVGISIELTEKDRKLNGYAWDDSRNTVVNNAIIGDGIRTNGEKGIAGITVHLVEKLSNGKEYLWRTAKTNKDGFYQFDGVVPGEYVIRFIYGNDINTVVTTYNNSGVSYNGQDYKSTVYQKDMVANKNLEKEYYDITEIEGYGKNLSDARDLWQDKTVTIKQDDTKQEQSVKLQGRETVNKYSSTLNNKNSEVLASPYKENVVAADIEQLVRNTYMVAETAIINLEGEKNATISIGKSSDIGNKKPNSPNGNYVLPNIDFGLTERPKAQLELYKTVSHVKVLLANKNVLFDTKETTNDLIWQSAAKYNLDSKIKNNKYPYTYRDNMLKELNRYEGNNNGIIQVTMDEEIMHGATIQISYKLGVKNSSEIDYTGKDFYYKGTITSESKLVTTSATKIIDYVSNNLQYNQTNNQDWQTITGTDIITKEVVNKDLKENVEKLNVILQTNIFAVNALEPGKEVEKEDALLLTQVLTPENEKDDFTYENIAEIIEATNTVGRRMAFSIVGNQDPLSKAQEVDSSSSEQVIILPPFGNTTLYLGLGIAIIAIIAGGIILIRKKVLK